MMDAADALQIVLDGLTGERDITVQLRMRKGLDECRLDQVIDALTILKGAYKGHCCIPKKLALAFLDIRTAFEAGAVYYDQATREKIEDGVQKLIEGAAEIFDDAN